MKPFRFAVQAHTAPDVKSWRELARTIESLGYSTMYMPDHFGDQWAPMVGLTVAAEATDRLNVGTLVFDNDYRHPVVLAKEAATLDLVTEGRFEFGIGAGWMRTDYEQSGIPYDAPGVRIDRLTEALAIMKAMWSEGSATFEGKHYTVKDAQGAPRPYTSPHPPIVIGGGGKRVLSLAAREANIVGVTANARSGEMGADAAQTAKAEFFKQRLQWIKDAAGDRFDDIEIQSLTFIMQVTEDRESVFENIAPLFGFTLEEAREVPLALVGTLDQICEILEQRREEYGTSYITVQDAALHDFAPVVERLAGK
ncbi:MAG TPA: TIGR03621 family F420-dependent LLM class oxidoreductase [Acidimicrobiales bacterium]|nr:TIGR03621 family F420-dependent LLM class oxidoreductase [Acidimicrobiales bacterium]